MVEQRRRPASIGRVVAAWVVVVAAVATPVTALAGHAPLPAGPGFLLPAPPDETCLPQATDAVGGFDVCSPPSTGNGGGGGFNFGGLLPLVGAAVVGAGLALVIAYLVLRRRAGPPLDPVDAGEWWTCRKCGRNNVVGSARCYSCGTWQA
jgi:hypothetical protein